MDYFDFYLMHAQDASIYEKYKKCRAYETALELKKERRIKHLGISFHDKAAVLDKILSEQPEVEVFQIQLNYVDYEDPSVESRKCYEVCEKYGKKVIVMEPIKCGSLLDLPAFEIIEKSQNVLFIRQENVYLILTNIASYDRIYKKKRRKL